MNLRTENLPRQKSLSLLVNTLNIYGVVFRLTSSVPSFFLQLHGIFCDNSLEIVTKFPDPMVTVKHS